MKLRKKAASIILHALLLLSVYVLQAMVFPYIRVAGMVPLLLPVAVAGTAVCCGGVTGGLSGLFAGILCDISLNQPAGIFAVLLTFAGILIGYLADTVMTRGFLTVLTASAVLLAVSAFAQMFPLLFFENLPPDPLIHRAVWQTLYSLAFALPLYFPVRALGRRVEKNASQ